MLYLTDWAAVATISTRKDIETFPTANLASIGDGPIGNGTGIPYMYLTPLDFTAKDLAVISQIYRYNLIIQYLLYYTKYLMRASLKK